MGNGMENSTVFSYPWGNSNQIKMEILSILKPDRLILENMHFNHNGKAHRTATGEKPME
mgnify:CR=1 FL=1